jgi:hypothetical protein
MPEKTELVTIRISRSLYSLLFALAKKSNLYLSEILKQAIYAGIKDDGFDAAISSRAELCKKQNVFYDYDEQIRISMKEAYLLDNFKRLINQLSSNTNVLKKDKQKLAEFLFKRIEEVEGKDSETYGEATKWLISNYPQLIYKSKESRCIAREGKDIITE